MSNGAVCFVMVYWLQVFRQSMCVTGYNFGYHLVDIAAILTHGKFAGDEDSIIKQAKNAGI